jgi:hypothetical protein
MKAIAIFYPVFALVALTFFIALWMARLRFVAVKRGDISRNYYKLNRDGEMPEYLAKVSRNFQNLLEIPILFYLAALMIFVTQHTDGIFVGLAWLYVLSRYIHSCIHTTYNNVRHRMLPFIGGSLVLMAIWLRLFWRMI